MHITNDPTNSDRAESGIVAINAYVNDAYMADNRDLSRDDDLDQAARDAIGDILHRLERARVHPGVILKQAYDRYQEEALADDPGDRPTVAYAFPCGYCGAERGRPCHWACESWGVSGQNRHTEPEQLDDEPDEVPAGQPVERCYEFGLSISSTAEVYATDADTAHQQLDALNGTTVTLSRQDGIVRLTCQVISRDREILKVTPPDPDLKPATETTITKIPL
ncbi:hypothetical protein [Nonomuraea basaltis]|uniref:hypothetical protein n=1 Tax=Nonomuraea basaltis TaxID=2495887 RepID=UPI00110C613D|nr:hypothetical protein [Nonomuraea basaltis]TMR92556.1 hypothetical protein EJK15_43930 [Nonomuraea basaltis]